MIISCRRVCSKDVSPFSQPLKQVENYKYLGVLSNSSLNWSTHIHNIWSRARHTVGLYTIQNICHSFKLFLTTPIIRPCASSFRICLCYAKKEIETLNLLEGVQKSGLRVCFKQYWSSHEAHLPVLKSWTFLKLYKTHGPSLNSHYHHNVHTCVCSYNSTFF